VFRKDRASGPVWYATYRLRDGRQVQKKLAPAWTRLGRPVDGFVNRRGAEAWLGDVLAQPHAGHVAWAHQDGHHLQAPFGEVAALLRRGPRVQAVDDGRLPPHGRAGRGAGVRGADARGGDGAHDRGWRASLTTAARTRDKQLTIRNGIFRRAQKRFGLQPNPVVELERMREPRQVNLDVFSAEEVLALVRAAESEQGLGAIYLTAAFTGLRRGKLIALRWRDVDFAGLVVRVRASYAAGALTSPKSGKIRSVPMAPQVPETLARLGRGAFDDGRCSWAGAAAMSTGARCVAATSSRSNAPASGL
jgi:hypothetical protein